MVEALESQGIRRLWLVGGGELAASFARQRLISELRIAVVPVLLGGGTRLFESEIDFTELELRQETRYSNGIVHLEYGVRPPRG